MDGDNNKVGLAVEASISIIHVNEAESFSPKD